MAAVDVSKPPRPLVVLAEEERGELLGRRRVEEQAVDRAQQRAWAVEGDGGVTAEAA